MENISVPATASGKSAPVKPGPEKQFNRRPVEIILTSLTLALLLGSVAAESAGWPGKLILTLNVMAYIAGGWFGFKDALRLLKRGHLDINFLMIFAAAGAALVDQWHEGAALLFLFSLSNTLQDYALERSRNAISKLLKLRPAEAVVLRGGQEVRVPIEDLRVGERIVIRPGEMLPIDGLISKGHSELNQASITGESVPVEKGPGGKVFAGSLNGSGALELEVTRLAHESTLSRIIQLVESAQAQKAHTQRFLENFETYYTWVVISAVALFILTPWLALGHPFQPTFYRAMVLLVVASPCALIISTPASILSAIANGARRGILFKGGMYLESMATIKVVAFDKTGTLTRGKLSVTDIVLCHGCPPDISEESLLALAAALESRSEHPIGKAVLRAAKERGLALPEMADFESLAGRGIRARAGGQLVWIGGERMFQEHGETLPLELQAEKVRLEQEGKTFLILHRELERRQNVGTHESQGGGWLGLIAVTDTIRPEAAGTIEWLKRYGISRTVMLTGDNKTLATAIAGRIGVDEFYSDLLPEEKVSIVRKLQERYGPVMMVGDGVNDAPALAVASIGTAMGAAGTDVALETADVVLMADDLGNIPYALELSRRARRIVWQNIIFSLAVIVTLVIALFGVFGHPLHLPVGVVGHEGSTLIVVANGLRLLAVYPQTIALAGNGK